MSDDRLNRPHHSAEEDGRKRRVATTKIRTKPTKIAPLTGTKTAPTETATTSMSTSKAFKTRVKSTSQRRTKDRASQRMSITRRNPRRAARNWKVRKGFDIRKKLEYMA